jgi:hypothetical protein
MNMLRHQYTAGDHKSVSPPHSFELAFKDAARCIIAQQREPSIATEREEVKVAGFLVTNKTFGHGQDECSRHPLLPAGTESKGWATPLAPSECPTENFKN